MSETDLSIGGEGQAGISLTRNYNSGVSGASVGPGYNWTFSVDGYVSPEPLPIYPDFEQPQPGEEPYIYNVVYDGKSVGFTGGSAYTGANASHTGGPVGTYLPVVPNGAQLVFNGTNGSTGYYTFTDADGTVINFTPGPNGRISNWTMPDGTRLDYTYDNTGVRTKSVISNRGWTLLFESATKVCAVNLAQIYVTATSTCPTDAQTVTYGTTAGTYNSGAQLLTSVTRDGKTATYAYSSKDHLNCVKAPGQAFCKIQTTYTECADNQGHPGLQMEVRPHDYVTGQQDASGKTYAYSYSNGSPWPVGCPKGTSDTDADYRPFTGSTAVMTVNGTVSTTFTLSPSGLPSMIKDPLDRTIWTGMTSGLGGSAYGTILPDVQIISIVAPEGNGQVYDYDSRGNITSLKTVSKSGSSVTTTATYPASCSNVITCNKPTAVTDARSNTTDFTYDATHGGVLTESAPADANGVRAVKRYAYVQRYAWIKNSGGGYSQVATPVWLLSTMKTCRTTATVGDACAGGATDEVITTYDYGPDSGPNNLLVRGVVVTADVGGAAISSRTCYAYDRDGNKISETKPRAGLTVCP